MAKKQSKKFQIENIPGHKYASLKEAQDAAMPELTEVLMKITRDLLAKGVLVVRDGKIVPARDKDK